MRRCDYHQAATVHFDGNGEGQIDMLQPNAVALWPRLHYGLSATKKNHPIHPTTAKTCAARKALFSSRCSARWYRNSNKKAQAPTAKPGINIQSRLSQLDTAEAENIVIPTNGPHTSCHFQRLIVYHLFRFSFNLCDTSKINKALDYIS